MSVKVSRGALPGNAGVDQIPQFPSERGARRILLARWQDMSSTVASRSGQRIHALDVCDIGKARLAPAGKGLRRLADEAAIQDRQADAGGTAAQHLSYGLP